MHSVGIEALVRRARYRSRVCGRLTRVMAASFVVRGGWYGSWGGRGGVSREDIKVRNSRQAQRAQPRAAASIRQKLSHPPQRLDARPRTARCNSASRGPTRGGRQGDSAMGFDGKGWPWVQDRG